MSIDQLKKPQGPQSLNFVAEQEPMLIYTLEDGTILKAKVVLMDVKFTGVNDHGIPTYNCQFQQVLHVTPGPTFTIKKDGQ